MFSQMNHSLHDLAVLFAAVHVPGSDVSRQDALNGERVEQGKSHSLCVCCNPGFSVLWFVARTAVSACESAPGL